MKKRMFALPVLLALLTMLWGGCGSTGAPSAAVEPPAESQPQSTASQPEADPEKIPEKPGSEPPPEGQLLPENVQNYGGMGDLYTFREWAAREYPDTPLAIAHVGTMEGPFLSLEDGIQSDGYAPFLMEVSMAGCLFAGTGQASDVWAVIAVDPETTLNIQAVEWNAEDVLAVPTADLYQGAGESPLLIWTDAGNPDPQAIVTAESADGPVTTQYLCLSEDGTPLLGNDGCAFDFTVYPDKTPAADWRVMGTWKTQNSVPDYGRRKVNAHGMLTLQLDGYALMQVQEVNQQSGRLSLYEGSWQRTGADTLTLDLYRADGTEAISDTVPEQLSGEYRFALGAGNVLTLQPVGRSPALLKGLTADTAWRHVNSLLQPQPIFGPEEVDACIAVLEYHNAIVGPADAALKVCQEQTGMLVRVFTGSGRDTRGVGWYVVNPYDLSGFNWVTGEQIDFSTAAAG